jgi:uracil-DNA glycosylase family 4
LCHDLKMNFTAEHSLYMLNKKIIQCKLCPRLSNYINRVGEIKVKRFLDEHYWAKPLQGFGDAKAKLLVIGLAPAAHGGNRTGRMFTGDDSGNWLAKAMFETRFANMPTSQSSNDGLILKDVYITAVVRCAPPLNKPSLVEISNCSQHLLAELNILNNTKVILTLGKIAFDTFRKTSNLSELTFYHGARYSIASGKTLLVSYHPSRHNTNTGKLTWQMWINIFKTARSIITDK